jgi:isopentenyl diphosphate isomerase/L-lactate dehydrogenase-like FMN-dependent dehydrogenase
MYTFGNAGTGSTYHNNLKALEQWRIVPRMLRNATHRNLDVGNRFHLLVNRADCSSQTTLFGIRLPSPIIVAPVGVQGILHNDGELATASAAASVGVPFVMSNVSSRSIEAVGKANGDGHRWYQFYWYDPPLLLPLLPVMMPFPLPLSPSL